MLCEIATYGGFFTTWVAITLIGLVMTGLMSGILFYRTYWKPTHETWQRKINPEYPEPRISRGVECHRAHCPAYFHGGIRGGGRSGGPYRRGEIAPENRR